MSISAKIVAHSSNLLGTSELITMEIELHRFILPEFNTHRVFSRNFQSSRAVPTPKLLKQVKENPAMPVYWGKNQSGMVADGELGFYDKGAAHLCWKRAAEDAASQAGNLLYYGAHKQIVNRLLEPFMWTRGVVTGTREAFEGFFILRCHKDAQPEIQALSNAMQEALLNSSPKKLKIGDYHLPYVENIGDMSIEDAVKVSVSCCAQVSYRALDSSLDKAIKIYNMLNLPANGKYSENPPHFSPTEHVARCREPLEDDEEIDLPWEEVVIIYEDKAEISGNFADATWRQYRKALEVGEENLFFK